MTTLGEKLDPRHFTAMSPKMTAIVAFILGDEAAVETDPAIAELIITSDGVVLARHEDQIGADTMIGSEADLTDNLSRLLVAAGLTIQEIDHFNRLYTQRVTTFRRTQ